MSIGLARALAGLIALSGLIKIFFAISIPQTMQDQRADYHRKSDLEANFEHIETVGLSEARNEISVSPVAPFTNPSELALQEHEKVEYSITSKNRENSNGFVDSETYNKSFDSDLEEQDPLHEGPSEIKIDGCKDKAFM